MTDFLERMPGFLRERIHAEGWTSWRGVQEDSFRVLFDTDDHLLISASTSSGKTEAAMLPVVSSLALDPPEGIGALYVGPTKALIDDQFSRMGRLLRDSPVEVTGWHGDVAPGAKDRLRTEPAGILQITPESLQGIVCDPVLAARMFPSLRFVVIDEVHTFMASDRGLQLMCELDALMRTAGCDPRRIGLSATISDTAAAEGWLAAGTGRRVSVVTGGDASGGRVGIKYARIPADGSRGEAVLAFYRELHRLTDPYSCIVFANSRVSAERTARSLRRVSESEGSAGQVLVHHGSISARLRREAEDSLRRGGTPTVVATSTLELGMDIGGLDRVVQVGAPYTCTSMLQRMGRTGRRGGRREMVVFCMDDASKWSPSPPGMSADLIRAIAVTDLAVREGWTEPVAPNPLPFGLLYHQIMAYLKGADHDVRWPELRDAMLSMWAFRNVSAEEIRELARHMLTIRHLERMDDGTLLIGIGAEPIVNGRGFASVFEAPAETEVRAGGEVIGTIQGTPGEGRLITLAGRSWAVRRAGPGWVDVVEASGGSTDTKWESPPPEVDDAVMARMRSILGSDEDFPWLDSAAREELEASRRAYREGGLDGAVPIEGGYIVYPWVGTRRFEALRRELRSAGVEVPMAASPLWLAVRTRRTWDEVVEAVSGLLSTAEPEDLVYMDDIESMGKYERHVPEGLRAREYAASRLTPWDPTDVVKERRRRSCRSSPRGDPVVS